MVPFPSHTYSIFHRWTAQQKQTPCFGECYTSFGYETKTGVVRILVDFQHSPMLTTSMESSRRDLLNDMAERRPILKNNQNT